MINYVTQSELLYESFKYVIKHNKSNINGYHNTHHLLNVFQFCCDAYEYLKLSKNDFITLGVAALFHDINHSGWKLSDFDNIMLSLEELKTFYDSYFDLFIKEQISIEEIVNLISLTEFPHKREPQSLLEKIIIDADMSSYYDSKWYFYIIEGFLVQELGKTHKEAIEQQIKFIENVKFHTDYGIKKHSENKERILNELYKLKI